MAEHSVRWGHFMIASPKNVVVLLLDSLNRHELGAYGGGNFDTPNLDRLAARSVRFTNHHAGSLPCIPARHDILVGAWDFLWKPWGSIELWEEPITVSLRRAGVVTQLITDHPHLFEVGGENYHTDFTAWSYERGHESDPWKTRPDASWLGAPSFGRGHTHYDNSRGFFKGEEDFPGPRTMQATARWLLEDAPVHRAQGERFFLFVDEFDPHEPFDTPARWADRYDDTWEGEHMVWPPYAVDAIKEVGPDGHFFGAEHTQSRYKDAFYSPLLSDWSNYEAWEEAGALWTHQRASVQYKTILNEFEPAPLDAALTEELGSFVARRLEEGGAPTDF